jgi:ABC-type siderophore export system fused ATPase/permease subunit
VALAVVVLFATSLLDLLGPYLTKIAIDEHIARRDLSGLGRIALLYLAVVISGFALEYLQFYVMQWVGQRIVFDLRVQILRHLHRQELAFFDRNPVGRLMTRVTSDVQALHELFTSGVVAIFGDVVTLVGIVVAMFVLDWRLALVANIVLPILLAIRMLFRARVRASYRDIRGRVAAMNSFLQEHITGMRVVQIFGHERGSRRRFDALNTAHRDAQLRTVLYYALFFPAVEIVSAVATGLILWFGGGRIVQNALEFGVLVAFMQYAERFFRPISDLSEKYNTFQAAMASSERIFKLLDRQPAIRSRPGARRLERASGHIVFENVRFGYEPGEPVLHDLSFEVQPGERVALVGATGAGKTSILSVLTRLYEIQGGRVLLDGTDIRDLALRPAPPGGGRAPGRVPVRRRHRAQHPARGDAHLERAGAAGGSARVGRPLHRQAAARLRRRGHGAGEHAVGRAAAAVGAGARPGLRPGHPGAREATSASTLRLSLIRARSRLADGAGARVALAVDDQDRDRSCAARGRAIGDARRALRQRGLSPATSCSSGTKRGVRWRGQRRREDGQRAGERMRARCTGTQIPNAG